MKKLLAALSFAGVGIVVAQDAPPAEKPAAPRNEQGGRPGRPGGGQFNPERFQANMIKRMEGQMAELLKEYDKNQDGTLDAEEKAFMEKDLEEALKKARLANTYQRIKVIDVDGDLKFSDEEKEKAPQRLREDMQKRGPGRGGFGGPGFGGPGFGPRDGQGPRGGNGGPRGGNGQRGGNGRGGNGPRGGQGPRGDNPPPEPPPAE